MDVNAALGRAWLDDRPRDLLTDLATIDNRMGGTPGEKRAAERVADAFAEAGVRDVREMPFETRVWIRGTASLDLLEPVARDFEAVALPYSPSADVRGGLVDVGHGTPDEINAGSLDGKVALASTDSPPDGRFVHRMETFGHAREAGAVGFVFANHVEGQLPPTGSLRFDAEASMPGVGVSKETGAWLREYADRGGEVRLRVDAATERGEARNVAGRLGPSEGEELLLVAHYDAHDVGDGALDNGCGVATLAVALRVLAAADLPRGVRVVATSCEETGLVGAERIAERIDLDRVASVVNVDGAGRFRDLVALTHASDATAAVAERVEARTDHPIAVESQPHPFSDQWPFLRRGIPALQLHSDSGERGRGWTHTAADTLEKVDVRNVREHGMLCALLVAELAAADPPRLDADDLAAAFRDAEFERGMRAAGRWPAEWD